MTLILWFDVFAIMGNELLGQYYSRFTLNLHLTEGTSLFQSRGLSALAIVKIRTKAIVGEGQRRKWLEDKGKRLLKYIIWLQGTCGEYFYRET